jgi:hypothetical protein
MAHTSVYNTQSGQWEDNPEVMTPKVYDPSAPNGVSFAGLLGPAFSGIANSLAGNRQFQAVQGPSGAATDTTGLKNFLHANYIASGGAGAQNATNPLLPNMLGAPTASTPQAQAFARQMRDELQQRLNAREVLSTANVPKAGWGEKLAGLLSFAAPLVGKVL